MIRLFLIRHGQSEWNADGKIQGHIDVNLSPKGKAEARMIAQRLKDEPLTNAYTSDLSRASVTAKIIAEKHNNLFVTQTPLLREADLGKWQGHTSEELKELFPDEFSRYKLNPVENRPPDGERLEEVIERSLQFLEMLNGENMSGNVLVVGHGGSIRGLICAAFGLSAEFFRRIRLDNAGLTIIDLEDDRPVLVLLNDTCHLRAKIDSVQEF